MSTASSAPTSVGFGLTVDTFNQIGSGNNIAFTITADPSNPDWIALTGQGADATIGVGAEVSPSNPLLWNFTLTGQNQSEYAFVGIFFDADSKYESPMGITDFPSISITPPSGSAPSTIQFDNTLLAVDYSFQVVVQQLGTGLLGIIDPDIQADIELG